MTARIDVEVAIIGAGFSGIAMALELQARGVETFRLFEAASAAGGTWRDNVYPGCGCDVRSHLYSLSRAPKPDWSRAYARQPEILQYIQDICRQFAVEDKIEYGAAISRVEFDSREWIWRIEAKDGRSWRARWLIFAVGGLNIPKFAAIPGLDQFQGQVMHSAQWDPEVKLESRRVAVIGTGASAIQIVPEIAEQTEFLQVYQRSAPWVVPRGDRQIPAWCQRLFENYPWVRRLYRRWLYWNQELRAWFFVGNPRHTATLEWLVRRHIRQQIRDPELRARVEPNYRMGCKRVLISDDYYAALQLPNVQLTNRPIARFTETGIETKAGVEKSFDVVVFATGFEVHDRLTEFEVRGEAGLSLAEYWADGAQAFYGLSMPGFPNLFMLLGPNSALGHSSVLLMIEAQARAISRLIAHGQGQGYHRIEVRPEAMSRFQRWIRERSAQTIWLSGCQSWYLDPNGQNTTLWPSYVFEYERQLAGLPLTKFQFAKKS